MWITHLESVRRGGRAPNAKGTARRRAAPVVAQNLRYRQVLSRRSLESRANATALALAGPRGLHPDSRRRASAASCQGARGRRPLLPAFCPTPTASRGSTHLCRPRLPLVACRLSLVARDETALWECLTQALTCEPTSDKTSDKTEDNSSDRPELRVPLPHQAPAALRSAGRAPGSAAGAAPAFGPLRPRCADARPQRVRPGAMR